MAKTPEEKAAAKAAKEAAKTELAGVASTSTSPAKAAYLAVIEKFKAEHPERYERQKDEIENTLASL